MTLGSVAVAALLASGPVEAVWIDGATSEAPTTVAIAAPSGVRQIALDDDSPDDDEPGGPTTGPTSDCEGVECPPEHHPSVN